MAIVVHSTADVTVNTISDRNSIVRKIDNMTVTVIDAIADVDAGQGVATYRWNGILGSWILISKSTTETISFATEELLIVEGAVTASNVPSDNIIWEIQVVDGNVVIALLRIEDLVVHPSNGISGLDTYSGKKLRFSYAYGTITQQMNMLVDVKVDKVVSTDNSIVRFDGITGDVQDSTVTIDDDGNIEISTVGEGVILASPNGTRYKITIADDGALISTAV